MLNRLLIPIIIIEILNLVGGTYDINEERTKLNDFQEGHIQLDVPMKNMTRHEGETLRVKCEITGFPLPKYSWYRDGSSLFNPGTSNSDRIAAKVTPWGSRLRISKLRSSDSGRYTCEGRNKFGHNSTSGFLLVKSGPNLHRLTEMERSSDGEKSLALDPDELLDLDAELDYEEFDYSARFQSSARVQGVHGSSTEGYCQPYRGAACSKDFGNKSILVNNDFEQDVKERDISVTLSRITLSRQISTLCFTRIIQALCYISFTPCVNLRGASTAKHLCPQTCRLLKEQWCHAEYHLSPDELTFILPSCDDRKGNSAISCISLDDNSTQVNTIAGIRQEVNKDCFNGTGRQYRGTIHTTASGMECMQWKSVVNQLSEESNNPYLASLANQQNYCRNPDTSRDLPWCYTIRDGHLTKENCKIASCDTAEATVERLPQLMLIVTVCIGTGLVIIFIILCTRHNRNRAGKKSNQSTVSVLSIDRIQLNNLVSDSTLNKLTRFNFSNILLYQELGEGLFGKAFRGHLVLSAEPNKASKLVVIHMLSPTANWTMQTAFWKEAESLCELNHVNVMSMIGFCYQVNQPQCILFDYPVGGTLLQQLISASPHTVNISETSQCPSTLQLPEMMNICIQIATGMEYLASKKFVHRDLAARNVYITDSGVIKISLLRIINSDCTDDYWGSMPAVGLQGEHNGRTTSAIPIRWLPLEAIFSSQYSEASDVWSFGVLMWEVFSYGLRPYNESTDSEVLQAVRVNQLLTCPHSCPHKTYSIMKQCWNTTPSERPSFRIILQKLDKIRNRLANNDAINRDSLINAISSPNSSNSDCNNTRVQNRIILSDFPTLAMPLSNGVLYQNSGALYQNTQSNGAPHQWVASLGIATTSQHASPYNPYFDTNSDHTYHLIPPDSTISSRSRSPATTNSVKVDPTVAMETMLAYQIRNQSPARAGFHMAFMRSAVGDVSCKTISKPIHL